MILLIFQNREKMTPHSMLKRIFLVIFAVIMAAAFVLPFILPPVSTSLPAENVSIFDLHRSAISSELTSEPSLEDDPFTLDFADDFMNVDVPRFDEIDDVNTKKRMYFDFIGMLAADNNQLILRKRRFIQHLIDTYGSTIQTESNLSIPDFQAQFLSSNDQDKLQFLIKEYRINTDNVTDVLSQLLLRVDTIPVELIQVQTANESGWGTSRFAVQGYNFFGLWCYQTGCGFVPKQRSEGMTHEVAKFSSPAQGMYRYIRNLNRNRAYRQLRIERQALRSVEPSSSFQQAMKLTTTLGAYSERGQAYIDELQAMLRVNRSILGISKETESLEKQPSI